MGSSPSRLQASPTVGAASTTLPAASVSISPSCNLAELSAALQQFMTRVDANFHKLNDNFAQLNARVTALESSIVTVTPKSTVAASSKSRSNPGGARVINLGFDPKATPPPVELKYDVFLSHRRNDAQDIMRSFKSELSPSGYRVYLDRDALTSTDDLMSSVAASKTLLFFLSQHIFESDWCIKELAQAVRYQRQILLVSVAGCIWMDEKQRMCEFPIHLFPKYIVEHGGTNGIAVSFHRDFFDVVMNKIKQRLGVPIAMEHQTLQMDQIKSVQQVMKCNEDNERLDIIQSHLIAPDLAAKEKEYEECLKAAAGASRKNVTEVMQRVATLNKRFLNAKDAIEAINWLSASEAMKGEAVSSIRQQGLDAILAALNKFSTDERIVRAAGAGYSDLLNEENLNLLSYQPLFDPLLTILTSPSSNEQLIEAVLHPLSMLAGEVPNKRDAVSVQQPFNVFLNSMSVEEVVKQVLHKYQDSSAEVTRYCKQILANLKIEDASSAAVVN